MPNRIISTRGASEPAAYSQALRRGAAGYVAGITGGDHVATDTSAARRSHVNRQTTFTALASIGLVLAGCSSGMGHHPAPASSHARITASSRSTAATDVCSAATTVTGPTWTSADAIAIDARCDLFVAADDQTVYKVAPNGVSTIFAGGKDASEYAGVPAAKAVGGNAGLAVDTAGDLFLADDSSVREFPADGGPVTTVVGSDGAECGYSAAKDEGKPAKGDTVCAGRVAVDSSGDVFVADEQANRVFKVTPAGTLATFVGGGTSAATSGVGTAEKLDQIAGISVGGGGVLYVAAIVTLAGQSEGEVLAVSPSDTVNIVAGGGVQTQPVDGSAGTSANIEPDFAVGGPKGSILLNNYESLYSETAGKIAVLAGDFSTGQKPTGNGGPATKATFYRITDAAFDASGNIYVDDAGEDGTPIKYSSVRRIATDGTITQLG
jgi:hypothetical protein